MDAPSPFSFVCRYCAGSSFTRTGPDRWDVGWVRATREGLPAFVVEEGSGGPLEKPAASNGVACDNERCAHFNEDVPHLPDLVVAGPSCWLPGALVTLRGVAQRVATIDPDAQAPLAMLEDGTLADPRELRAAVVPAVSPDQPPLWS